MVDLILLWILNLLFPEEKTASVRKDEMDTAAAFFYGTSFDSIGKESGRQPDTAAQDERTHESCCDYDDWLDF